MQQRFAIYYAPSRDSLLCQFGCRWLGRDPENACHSPRFAVPGFTREELVTLTSSPSQYGFHATLKAPFHLTAGKTDAELHEALRSYAAALRAFALPPLALDRLGGFLALRPSAPSADLQQLADGCVEGFDRFRRPTDETELRRRNQSNLTERQTELLNRFGYPYVLDQFRFHLTLTERLSAADAGRLHPWLEFELGAALAQQQVVKDLCLFVQDAAGEAFRLERRYAFGAAS